MKRLSFDIVIIIIVLVHSQAQGQRSFLGFSPGINGIQRNQLE
jgi:hypothetical protein